MSTSLEQLRLQEARLPNISFTKERSPLNALNLNFPSIGGRDFKGWINHYSQDGRLVEIGGGVNQTAALEILRDNPGLALFLAIEPRYLSGSAEESLRTYQNYQWLKSGLSQLPNCRVDGRQDFDIVFANFVAMHLPRPFDILSLGLQTLRPGGILFCSQLPAFRENLNEVVQSIKDQRGEVVLDYVVTERNVIRQGGIYTNIAVRVEDPNIVIPDIIETPRLTFSLDSSDSFTQEFGPSGGRFRQ